MSRRIDTLAVAAELKRREELKGRKKFKAEDYCFPRQLEFIRDPSRFKIACTGVRSGKTMSIAADMIDTCDNNKDVMVAYITLAFSSARRIIWPEIKRLLEDFKVPSKVNDQQMTVYFPDTRSTIMIGGAKDDGEYEKYRGLKLKKVYIDEAQSFRPSVKYFVNDVLVKRLRDLRGQLILTGTPAPIPAGYFYEVWKSEQPESSVARWSKHHWTAFDNPHMIDLEQTLAEERAAQGITESDPAYRRETYGEWVEDRDSLVHPFNPLINVTTSIPTDLEYVLGIDIGYEDSDAIAVLGYRKHEVYLVEEFIMEKLTTSDLAERIKFYQRRYKPTKMVMDAGALGKKIQADFLQRYQLHIAAAEKERKLEFIELLNDELRTGRFKALPGSRFEQDCNLVMWERDSGGVRRVSDKVHSDIHAAVLYGWRECRQYVSAPTEKPKVVDERDGEMQEFWENEERKMLVQQQGLEDFEEDFDEIKDTWDW